MKRLLAIGVTVTLAASAWATATLDPDTNILTFDVESGEETYTTALTSSIAGIVKTGAGTIILSTASASFTGGKPITISGGAIEVRNADALGSGNVVTVANGATFRMVYDSGNGQANDVVLQGGSTLYLDGGGGNLDYFIGNVTLAGNATINTRSRRGFGKTLDLGGHTLTRIGANVEFVFSGNGTAGSTAVVRGPGTVCNAATGTITFMGSSVFDGDVVFESAASGTTINMWNRASPVPCTLRATENTSFKMGRGLIGNVSNTPLANIWNGNVEIASGKTLKFTGNSSYPGDYLTVGGVISGAGAVEIPAAANGTIVQFKGVNTYTGGTTVAGTLLRACVEGAVPTSGGVGALVMSGGELQLSLDAGGYTDAGINALLGTLDNNVSDSGMVTVYTSAGTDATCAADFSRMHPSISIWHKGEGKATLTGAMPPGAMLRNSGGGAVEFGGNVARELWSFQVFGGTMDVTGGSLRGSYYDGKRVYVVGSSNDVSNARMRVFNGATLHFPCRAPTGNEPSEPIAVQDTGTKPAILEIHDGATVTGKVQVALVANSKGAVYQYGGDVFHTTRPGNDGAIGYEGRAYWWMNGGTLRSDNADPYLALATRTGSESQMEVQGGTVSISGNNSLMICRGGASNAEFYMGGGTATISQIKLGGELLYGADHGADAGGQAVLTLSGTNNPSLAASSLRLNERTNEFTSVVNLNAGQLVLSSAILDATRTVVTRRNCRSFVNFNGGTLKSSSTAVLSATDSAPTRVTVFGKGATIDYNGGNANWNVPFLRPDGRGIKSITIPSTAAVTGYALPPVVTISGGGGEGATAHVLFDPRTGTIARDIEVTSPGWGFFAAPTVTITAPDMKTSVACDVELTEGEQEDGGITKKGTGLMYVYAANSYTGDTVVAEGTFYMQNGSALPPASNVRLAGGHFATKQFNPVRARLSGYGTFASWDNNDFTITNEISFLASDLEEGRKMRCNGGKFHIGADCVIAIDGLDSLAQDKYTLMDTSGTGVILGQARLAGGGSQEWKVSVSGDGKKMTLRRVRCMTISIW